MILADTSVWIDHLRKHDNKFASCLHEGYILLHPFVVGELACGNLQHRQKLLALLDTMPTITIITKFSMARIKQERSH